MSAARLFFALCILAVILTTGAGVYAFYAEDAGDREIALLAAICALIVGVVFGLSGVKETTEEDLRKLDSTRDWPMHGKDDR